MPKRSVIKLRIAPTPSGLLHVGNGVNILVVSMIAKYFQGELSLRIDDIDGDRCRDEYLEDIFDTLSWMQINYDNGPNNIQDFKENYSQRDKMELYKRYLEQLIITGKTYSCICSRKELANNRCHCVDENHIYCKGQSSIKISTDPSFKRDGVRPADVMDDFVIWRRDDLPSYQLVSAVEDEINQIDLIVRGADLLSSTVAQSYLATLLNLKYLPKCNFFHHDLVMSGDGQKLSKSKGAGSLKELRVAGKSFPEQYVRLASKIFEEYLTKFSLR